MGLALHTIIREELPKQLTMLSGNHPSRLPQVGVRDLFPSVPEMENRRGKPDLVRRF